MHAPTQLTAFAGPRKVAAGTLHAVAQTLKELVTRDPDAQILIFDDTNGSQVDLNLHGSLDEVLQRLPREAAPAPQDDTPAPARTAGRPRLGVVAREITLLPRHWEWLATQPGGASVALRKLVEQAQRGNKAHDEQRQAREAAYKVMNALAGDAAGFEEASRALFAGRQEAFLENVRDWPADVREHVLRLARRGLSDS
ncbi:DUF2239 domain-containing protein [Janthinobacterium sp. BJB1]|uniref:DUF2239 family protein n=1 Tax=Janthinobacterium sp. GW458P TaxID=1981504 RepID=UPI000A31E948|nr:DUF2239 family protein [Janthinobacterium sp. GW458P]MBE3023198.1 DUF2239 family protein [Janthinobacterium sp. GW458P]PHV16219.1 DUF2239 domain-containing protein [Janthinobacterium sp. BJB303]PJC98543.1 DUF2239 domain-containing protein [Janthinobacterium sp. BJB1]